MRHHQQCGTTDPNKQQNTFQPPEMRPYKRTPDYSLARPPICLSLGPCAYGGREKSKRTLCTWPLQNGSAMTHFPNKRKQHFINIQVVFGTTTTTTTTKRSRKNRKSKMGLARLPDGVASEPFVRTNKNATSQQVKGGKKPLEIKIGCLVLLLAMRKFPTQNFVCPQLVPTWKVLTAPIRSTHTTAEDYLTIFPNFIFFCF